MAFDLVAMTGDKQVDMMLRTMEPKLQKKTLRKGTRAGAKIVLATAKQRVPVRTGNLQRTMKVRAAQYDRESRMQFRSRAEFRRSVIGHSVAQVAPKGEKGRGTLDPFYGFFVEYGTKYMDPVRYIRSSLYDNRRQVVNASLRAIRKDLGLLAATGLPAPTRAA